MLSWWVSGLLILRLHSCDLCYLMSLCQFLLTFQNTPSLWHSWRNLSSVLIHFSEPGLCKLLSELWQYASGLGYLYNLLSSMAQWLTIDLDRVYFQPDAVFSYLSPAQPLSHPRTQPRNCSIFQHWIILQAIFSSPRTVDELNYL